MHVLGFRVELELRDRRAARLLTPAAAAHPAMVYRQYRLPSRPPSQSAYPKLPARSLSSIHWRAAVSADTDAANSPPHAVLCAVGRASRADGEISLSAVRMKLAIDRAPPQCANVDLGSLQLVVRSPANGRNRRNSAISSHAGGYRPDLSPFRCRVTPAC